MHPLKRGGASMAVLGLLTFLAYANGEVQKQKPAPLHRKDASGCTLVEDTYYSSGVCVNGPGGCYRCERTDQYGTYNCTEAPNPNDGTYCVEIDYQDY